MQKINSSNVTSLETNRLVNKIRDCIQHPEFIDEEFLIDQYLNELASSNDIESARKRVERYLQLQKKFEQIKIN